MLRWNNRYELAWTQRYASKERIWEPASIANVWTETRECKEEHHQLPSLTNVHETNDWTSQAEEMSIDAGWGVFFWGGGIVSALEFDDYKEGWRSRQIRIS